MARYKFAVLPTDAEMAAFARQLGVDSTMIGVVLQADGTYIITTPVTVLAAAPAEDLIETIAAVANGLSADADVVVALEESA